MSKITDAEITGINAARAEEVSRAGLWRQQKLDQNAARATRLANRLAYSSKVQTKPLRKWAVNLCLLAAAVAVFGTLAVILGCVQ
jgi:hypothetical protein